MSSEPLFEKTIALPLGYVFTARARPSSIRRTAFRLLPWALVAAAPAGRPSRVLRAIAGRFSPLAKYRIQ